MPKSRKPNVGRVLTRSKTFLLQKAGVINDQFEIMNGFTERKISIELKKIGIKNYLIEEISLGQKVKTAPQKFIQDDSHLTMDPSLFLTPQKPTRPPNKLLLTPIQTKLTQLQGASEDASMTPHSQKSMRLLSCVAVMANHLVNSTLVRERVEKHIDFKILPISDKIDYIANGIIMSRRDSQVDVGNKTFKFNIHTQQHIAEDTTTTTCTRVYKQTKASLIPSLGTYAKIALKANEIMLKNNIDNQMLANLATAVSNGFKVEYAATPTLGIFIAHLNTLLFGEEAQRNVTSYITNHMFMDLIKDGIFTFHDLPSKLPMAMSGAVTAFRTLDNKIFGLIKRHSPYDKSEKINDINSPQVKELITRSNEIITEWLIQKGISSDILQNLDDKNLQYVVATIKNGITQWYGNSFSLDQLPTSAHDEQESTYYTQSDMSAKQLSFADSPYADSPYSEDWGDISLPPVLGDLI